MPSEPSARSAIVGWDIVVGQEKVKALLRVSIAKNRLAHAYLFSGPEGAGMDAMALGLAAVVHCEKGGQEACGTCRNCLLVGSLRHPDLFVHFPLPVGRAEKADDDPLEKLGEQELEAVRAQLAEKAVNPYHVISVPRANQIKINSIRQLRRQASLGSFGTGKRVFVLLGADRMTPEASNALLKTLEEPTPGTLIILTSEQPESLLPTVVSRCQNIRFDPLDEREIASAVETRLGVERSRARLVARLSAGSFSGALRLLETDLTERRDEAVDLLRSFLARDRREVLDAVAKTAELRKSETGEMLLLLQAWLRDAMLLGGGGRAEINVDDAATLGKFVRKYPAFDYRRAMDAIDTAISDLSKNVYIHLILLTMGADLRRAAAGPEAVSA